jgi:hypothetical protein
MTTFSYDAVAHKIDQSMWQWIDAIAQTSPNAARILALPAAVETLAKDLFYAPGCILETFCTSIGFVKDILLGRADGSIRHWMWIDARNMWWHAAKCAAYLPVSPVVAAVDCVRIFSSMAISPVKTGKKEEASTRINDIIYELLLTTSVQNTAYLPFFSKRKTYSVFDKSCVGTDDFVQEVFSRFKKSIIAARTSVEVINLHFADIEESRQQLKGEILEKCTMIRESHEQGYSGGRLKAVQDAVASASEKEAVYEELNALWISFQQAVVRARPEELALLKFNPNVEEFLINAAVNTFKNSSCGRVSPEQIEKVRTERVH